MFGRLFVNCHPWISRFVFFPCACTYAHAHMHLEILNEYVTHFCFDPLINIINKMVNNNSNIHIFNTFSLFNTAQFCRGITDMIVEQNTITFLFVLHDFITFYLTTGSCHHSKMAEATGHWLGCVVMICKHFSLGALVLESMTERRSLWRRWATGKGHRARR